LAGAAAAAAAAKLPLLGVALFVEDLSSAARVLQEGGFELLGQDELG